MGSSTTLRLNVLGQALIQHGLRTDPRPDFVALAEMFDRADLCSSGLETAIRSPTAEAPTREGALLQAANPTVDCGEGIRLARWKKR